MLHEIKHFFHLAKNRGSMYMTNYFLAETSNKLELSHNYGQPINAQIEVTTYCNAGCVMCPRTYMHSRGIRSPKHMILQDFKKIIFMLPYCESIRLYGGGEPLLNPDIIDIIKFCKEKKIRIGTTTSAAALSKSTSRELILHKLDHISFSIDSPNKQTFNRLRKGVKFRTVIKNIKMFVKLVDELKSDTPFIMTKTVVSKENINEIIPLLKLIKSLGIRNVLLQGMGGPWNNKFMILSEDLPLLEEYKKYGKSIGLNVSLAFSSPPKAVKIKCWKLWKSVYIRVDGSVSPCCFMPLHNCGNVLMEDFNRIWNGKEYRCLRKKLRNGNHPLHCIQCVHTRSGPSIKDET